MLYFCPRRIHMRPLLILSFLLVCGSAFARTIGVPGDASTIQAGINAASSGDTVLVQPGRYLESIDFKGKDIVVGSLFLATRDSSYIINTIIDAKQKNTVVTFQNGETSAAELCGFTIKNGISRGNASSPDLNPSGGIFCKNASPFLHHLVVESNNSGLDGGGMYLEKSNSIIEYCVVKNNTAVMYGSGMFIYKGNIIIRHCLFDYNKLACIQSKAHLYRVLITNNRIDATLFSYYSEINIINCSIVNNHSEFYLDCSDVNIINSIFWNDSPQINIVHGDSNIPVSHVMISFSNIKGGKDQIQVVNDSLYYENNNINSDPLLRNVENGDFFLNKNSPCINTGIAFYKMRNMELNLTKEDFRGSAPDMGAFESDDSSTIVDDNTICPMSLSNSPNPFNSSTTIHYSLSKPSHVSLAIYSITGQKILDLLEKTLPVGNYQAQWNGKDISGNSVSSGVYIIRLNTGMHSVSKRALYMK